MTNKISGVSIIIPAHNAAEFIAQALESLIAQSAPNWEAIVVVDGSTDQTLATASRTAGGDSRFRVVSQAHQGVSVARNAGIHQAQFDWLLFLDADDWILPDFLERVTRLLEADPDLDAAYCGYARQYPDGSQIASDYSPATRDMFPILTRYCAFPIHTCIVRRSYVENAGGFDPSLVTCEDWDLWQRIARSGARFSSVNEVLACYRVRPKSASMDGQQMLRDGLRVIQRGHAVDPRVQNAHPAWAAGMPVDSLAKSQLSFTCWPAGLAIGSGQDGQFLLKELRGVQDPGLEPQSIAYMFFISVVLPDCRKPTDWPDLWPIWQPRIHQFLLALEEQSLTPGLTRRVSTALERMIMDHAVLDEPVTIGRTAGIRVEVTHPLQDLCFSKEVERAYCRIEMEGEYLGSIDLPVFGEMVSRYVLRDAIAAEYAWRILGRFFEHSVYPDLALETLPTGFSVRRGNLVLADGLANEGGRDWPRFHDYIGWLVFMQELWSRPEWENMNFYEEPDVPEPAAIRPCDQDAIWVEVSDELSDIQTSRKTLQVIYSVGGAVIGSIRLLIDGHLLHASQLRIAINDAAGFELCRAAVREGLLGKPLSGGGSLRTRLAAAASAKNDEAPLHESANEYVPLTDGEPSNAWDYLARILSEHTLEFTGGRNSLMIGRRFPSTLGTSHSRRAVLPIEAASELIEATRTAGETVLQPTAEKRVPEQIVYVPELVTQPDRDKADLSINKIVPKKDGLDQVYRRDHFESIFANGNDPWKYTSDYERVKYEQTLSLLSDMRYGKALEIGCAEGHFTAMLAPRVEQLIAADISEIALDRASQRCTDFKNIRYRQLDLTKDPLDGPIDLIVCSEILYYVGDQEALKAVVQKIASALKPGGYFLTAHAHLVVDEPNRTGFDWAMPFGAKVISDYFQKSPLLALRTEIRTPLYRVQLFQRQSPRSIARLLNHPQITKLEHQPTNLLPEIASHVLWNGAHAKPDLQTQTVTTKRLPILMYHRIAPQGSSSLANYRVSPEVFHDQLRYLSDAGYYSLTLDEWHVARDAKKPLPGKPIILTFDDGYYDFIEYAWPLLERYGFSATVFLVSNEVGKTNRWDGFYGESLPLLDWPDIRLLRKEGIEFGSHTASHPHLNGIALSEVVKEASISRKVLQEQLGEPIHSFAYPHGSMDRVVQHLVGACGYVYGLTIVPRLCEFNDPLLALPRVEVSGSDDLQKFIQKLQSR